MRPSSIVHEEVRPQRARPTLTVVPEQVPPERRQVPLLTAVVAAVVAVLLGVTSMYMWQHGLVTDRNATIVTMRGDASQMADQLAIEQGRVAVAHQVIASQQTQNVALRARSRMLLKRYRIAVGNQVAAERALAQSQAQLQAANHTVQTLVGSPLADGTYVGYLMAVGAQQAPPRLVIDRAKMLPGQGLVDESPAWRTVPIAPTASVVVLSLQPYHPQTISLDRFAHLFVNPAPWADPVTHAPFRITVSGGVVTSIREIRPDA